MDFYKIKVERQKDKTIIFPDWINRRSNDLMVRGKDFYAIWDEENGMWSTDAYRVQTLIDKELAEYSNEFKTYDDSKLYVKYLESHSTKSWIDFENYISHIPDSYQQLDQQLTFADTVVKKEDYVSKRLTYSLVDGECKAWDEMVGTLYSETERAKIEWAIGAIVSGDSKKIQKFLVLYGDAGAGKSTILNIIQKLFDGYYTTFEASQITSSNNQFSTEAFMSDPLVAIQHDGDLSKIEDNSKLNSIISHEYMLMNVKYHSSYMAKVNAFLFMATNKPVKITDAKSGIIRRLIDVHPSGNKLPPKKYDALNSQIDFELGAIANHCLKVYQSMGANYYNNYVPIDMMFKTDIFFNFVEDSYIVFSDRNGTSLKEAFGLYKEYCKYSGIIQIPMHKFREELKNYFDDFKEVARVDGNLVRSWYSGFKKNKFTMSEPVVEEHQSWIIFENQKSILDEVLNDCPAQYASVNDKPVMAWDNVTTSIKDIDTTKVHYVKPPGEHIVIDFDLKDKNGEKSMVLNMEAASKWPPTYAELSKSGQGIHLHYIYDGDPLELSALYDTDIEIKVFKGNASLRRRLSMCNNIDISHISTGLPLKGKKVVNNDSVKDELHLRKLIAGNLLKKYHSSTASSISFIYELLEKCYNSGMHYDVSDMAQDVLTFAMGSTHQARECIAKVNKMHFKSDEPSEPSPYGNNAPLCMWDVEVYPNLFVVCYKIKGELPVKLINPSPEKIQELLAYRLIGFNNKRYDNHIMYARSIGYTNEQLFHLSQKIVNGERNSMFGEAYNISYTDIYDFSSDKKSLKKWEIELGLPHVEMDLPWDEPVPEELWDKVASYCINDVNATDYVFDFLHADFVAREILADLAGMTVNDSTNNLTCQIIFGDERNPQSEFVYPNLAEEFPGYTYDAGKSYYNGELIGEGGRVWAKPGMYPLVITFDVASMHPHSIIAENGFGKYTANFKDLVDARVYIKHEDYAPVREMFNGKLSKYLNGCFDAEDLANALKIAINAVYGQTAASYPNRCRDPRNRDNWVAKRGALFMETLRKNVIDMGGEVIHIKTDSIKVVNPNEEITNYILDFGKQYGYTFEIESEYEKICLIDNAQYIAKCTNSAKNKKAAGKWTAKGAQFSVPYVFKTLFSKEEIIFEDYCEIKAVKDALYIDKNEELPTGEHDYNFIGKVGKFCPIKPGCGGGLLVVKRRSWDEDNQVWKEKYDSASGAKGWRWLESEEVIDNDLKHCIDESYFIKLTDEAKDTIDKFGDFEMFRS